MRRSAARFGVAPLVALGLAAGLLAQGQQPVFRAGVNLITVDAYPRRDGKIVEGLTPADFQVLEDGKPQKIETFEFIRVEPTVTSELSDPNNQRDMLQRAGDPHNRVFVAYLDSSFVTVDGAHNIRQPLIDLLDHILAPNDLFGVLTDIRPVSSLVLQRRTESIDQQLTEFWPWGERERIVTNPDDAAERALEDCFGGQQSVNPELLQRLREDRTLQHLSDLVSRLGSIREARSIVVLVTNGWLLFRPNDVLVTEVTNQLLSTNPSGYTPMPPITAINGRLGVGKVPPGYHDDAVCMAQAIQLAKMDDEQRFQELMRLANQKNVSFYPVNPGGLEVWDEPPASTGSTLSAAENMNRARVRVDTVKTLAENTDGVAVAATNDLKSGMQHLADDVSAYYLLSYYSTNPKTDGHFRQIKVRVNQPKVEVSARRGYLAPTDAAMNAATAARAAAPAIAPGIESAVTALGRLDSDTEVFVDAHPDGADLVVATELASRLLTSGDWLNGGDVRVTVSGVATPATGTIAKLTRGTLVRVPVGDAAGPWTVKVTVTSSGKTTQGEATAARSARTVLGDPTVFRGAGAASAPLRACADFGFTRTERLRVEVPLAGALDQRTARVLDRRGQPMPFEVALSERDSPTHALTADLSLAPFAAADYVIEIRATAGSTSDRLLVPFRVVR